jgi:ABC-type multidrug transport system ATPase subunit
LGSEAGGIAIGPCLLDVRDIAWVAEKNRRPLSRPLSFSLAAGEALALTGPAGSGKSTLLRILAGAVRTYAGKVLFQGKELGEWSREFFEVTSAVLDPSGLAPQLTALENLEYRARLYRRGDPASARKALEQAGLAAAARIRVAKLGSDDRFLVALAQAQLNRPALLCVDIPTAGLAPAGADRLGDALRARKAEGLATVLAARDGAWAAGLCGRALRLGADGAES